MAGNRGRPPDPARERRQLIQEYRHHAAEILWRREAMHEIKCLLEKEAPVTGR